MGKNLNDDDEYDEHYVRWDFKKKKNKEIQRGLGCLGHDVIIRDQEAEIDFQKDRLVKHGGRKNHSLKMYVKTKDTVRFEDKAYRMDRRFPFIRTLGDLITLENIIQIQNILFVAMGKIVFIPLSFAKLLPAEESNKWLLKREISEWEKLKLTSAPYVISREKERLYKELVKKGGKDWRQILLSGMKAEAALMLESFETAMNSLHGLLGEFDAGATSACVESKIPHNDNANVGGETSSPRTHTTTCKPRGAEGRYPGIAPLQADSASTAHKLAVVPSARGPPLLFVHPPSAINVLVLGYLPSHGR